MSQVRPASSLLLGSVLVSLAVGIGLGGVLFSGSPSQEPPTETPSGLTPSQAAPPASTSSQPRLSLDPISGARSLAPVEVAEPTGVSKARLDEAKAELAAPELPPAPTGSGQVHIEVTRLDGTPLEGVTVRAMAFDPNALQVTESDAIGIAAPALESLDEALEKAAETWANRRSKLLFAVTGPDGTASLSGLAPSSYDLRAYREGWVITSIGRSTVRPGEPVHFTAKPLRELTLDVRLPDGSQPPSAVIELATDPSVPEHLAWSPAQPVVRTGLDRFLLTVLAEPLGRLPSGTGLAARYASMPLKLDLDARDGSPLVVQLTARCGIHGQVISSWGGSSSRVTAIPIDDQADFDPKQPPAGGQEVYARAGEFTFQDLEPGLYAVGIAGRSMGFGSSSKVMHVTFVQVTDGFAEATIRIGPPSLADSVVLHCSGPGGEPLEGLSFRRVARQGGGSSSGSVSATEAPGAAYWFPTAALCNFDFDAWPAKSSIEVTASSALYGSQSIELASGKHEYQLSFSQAGALEVTIVGYAERLRSSTLGVRVVDPSREQPGNSPLAESGEGSSNWDRKPTLSSSGQVVFDSVPVGSWRVELTTRQGWGPAKVLDSVNVQIGAGASAVQLTLPRLHELAVLAPNLPSGATLILRDSQESGAAASPRWGRLDEMHRCTFGGLLAGTYTLQSNGAGEPVEVSVPGPEFLFEVRRPNAYRVTISDVEGALYKAGFRSQDLITALDGASFETADGVPWLAPERFKSAMVATVVRGGELLSLTLGPLDTGGYAQLGGSLSPTTK